MYEHFEAQRGISAALKETSAGLPDKNMIIIENKNLLLSGYFY